MSRWERKIAYMQAIMDLLQSLPLEHMPYHVIAKELEDHGHRTVQGEAKWHPGSVRRLLMDTGYEHLVAKRQSGAKPPPLPTDWKEQHRLPLHES